MRAIARPIGLAASLLAGLCLCACRGPRPHAHAHEDHGWPGAPASVADTLDCPDMVGGLSRTAKAGDGQSCDYRGAGGELVEVKRILPAGRPPEVALAPIEAALKTVVQVHPSPAAPASAAKGAAARSSEDADDDSDSDADDDSDKSDKADKDGGSDDDHANINLPGVHINANGDKADVKVFGVSIHADGDNANIDVGHGGKHATVVAGPQGAEIHANDTDSSNIRMALILAADHPGPNGYLAAGYLARGPVGGPLVVVTFKAGASHGDWQGDHDLNSLLDLNVKQ